MYRPAKAPLCKGGWQKSLISDWGIVLVDTLQSLRLRFRAATSLYTREALVPTIILQITLLVSVNKVELYCAFLYIFDTFRGWPMVVRTFQIQRGLKIPVICEKSALKQKYLLCIICFTANFIDIFTKY